jgi:hypothetical protein
MTVRATMQAVILAVRDRIGDNPADQTKRVWTDDQIQQACDRERTDFILGDYRELAGRYKLPSGSFAWTDYFDPSGWGDWETDALLYNGSMVQLTPLTSDYLVGHWTFANQPPPVFIQGQTYDVPAAAAIIVQQWLGVVALQFDFSAMRGTSFNVSQKREGLLMLLAQLQSEMRVRTAKLVRRDTTGAFGY